MLGWTSRLRAGAILATGLFASALAARADAPPLVSVPPEAYTDQPAGIRMGGLLYHASLVSGTIWDSNIFSSKENIIADRILYMRPGLTVSTLDPNYNFTLRTSLDHFEYDKVEAEGRTDARVDLKGTIRVQRGSFIDIGLAAGHLHEPRSILRRDLPEDAAEPVLHNEYTARLGFRRTYNELTSSTTATFENENYYDVRSNAGTNINLQYLDRDKLTIAHEEKLKVSQRLLLFSRQRVIDAEYRNVATFDQRDSIKFETVNGIEVAFTPLIKGKFQFHYAEEHFRSNTYQSDPERVYSAQLTWSPARHVRMTANFVRDFGGINFDLDASGGRRTRAEFALEYDITRQLFFRTSFAYKHANEAGIITTGSRLEDTYQYKNSLGYALNRHWSLFLDYAYERRDANIEINQFDRHVIQAGAVARF